MPDLVFDSSFECGNVGRVERLSKYEYEIRIRPDMHNDRHRLWFYFKVTDAERGRRVLFRVFMWKMENGKLPADHLKKIKRGGRKKILP